MGRARSPRSSIVDRCIQRVFEVESVLINVRRELADVFVGTDDSVDNLKLVSSAAGGSPLVVTPFAASGELTVHSGVTPYAGARMLFPSSNSTTPQPWGADAAQLPVSGNASPEFVSGIGSSIHNNLALVAGATNPATASGWSKKFATDLTTIDQVIWDVVGDEAPESSKSDGEPASASQASKKQCGLQEKPLPGSLLSTIHAAEKVSEHFHIMGKDIVYMDVPGFRVCWLKPKLPVVHPEAKARLLWMIIGFLFIVYEAYAIPFYLAFDVQATGFLFVVVSVINTYFILELPVTFLSGFMDNKGVVVMDLDKIAFRYARGWLLLDIVGGVPWEWIIDPENQKTAGLAKSIRFVRAFRLLRLTRLLRLMKLKSFMEKVGSFMESNQVALFIVGILKVLFGLAAVTHWTACGWFLIGSKEYAEEEEVITWVKEHLGTEPQPVWIQYIYSFYFALATMTTVGYGDVHAYNNYEVLYSVGILLIATLVFPGLMGVLNDLIMSLNNQNNLRAEKKMTLARYMQWRTVPRKLAMSIRQHLLFLWDTNEGYDDYEGELKGELPPTLKTDLCHHIYGRILGSAPFLGWMTGYHICIKELSGMVSSVFREKGDHLFRMGEPNEQIYVLLSGTVWLSRNESLFDGDEIADGGLEAGMINGMSVADAVNVWHVARKKESSTTFGVALKMSSSFAKQTVAVGGEKIFGKMTSFRGHSGIIDSGTSVVEPEKVEEDGQRGSPMFDSVVLKRAELDLRRFDSRRRCAAQVIQRRWRKFQEKQGAHIRFSLTRSEKLPSKSVTTMKSKVVDAPAYFGESCIWLPFEQWSTDVEDPLTLPLYVYTARCETRAELVYIPRTAIRDIILRFSPWLEERFDFFRKSVVTSMSPLMRRAVDWAAVDMSMPEFGVTESLTKTQTSVLLRGSSSSSRGGSLPKPHAVWTGPSGSHVSEMQASLGKIGSDSGRPASARKGGASFRQRSTASVTEVVTPDARPKPL